MIRIRDKIQGIRELPDGYALLLAGEPKPILALLELLPFERLACRFSSIAIATELEDDEPWVRFTGSDGVKQFLRDELFGG